MNSPGYQQIASQRRPSCSGQGRQAGLTLIELMVALALSLLVVLALLAVFLSGRTSFLTQEQQGRLQENGRYAFQALSRELQNSGYAPDIWDPPRFGFAMIPADSNQNQITLQYASDRNCNNVFNPVMVDVRIPEALQVSGGPTTRQVPAHWEKVIEFTVDQANGQLLRRCSYQEDPDLPPSFGGADVLADGVEAMEVRYGLDTDGDLSVNQWLTAPTAAQFASLVSVRVALLLRTPEEFTVEADVTDFDLLGTTVTAPGDRRLRRVYVGQVNLRNLTL